jgi:hypothetical protein
MNKRKEISRYVFALAVLIGAAFFNACVPTPTNNAPTAAQIFTTPKTNFHFPGSTASVGLSALDGVTVCYTTINAKLFLFNGVCRASGTYAGEIARSHARKEKPRRIRWLKSICCLSGRVLHLLTLLPSKNAVRRTGSIAAMLMATACRRPAITALASAIPVRSIPTMMASVTLVILLPITVPLQCCSPHSGVAVVQ